MCWFAQVTWCGERDSSKGRRLDPAKRRRLLLSPAMVGWTVVGCGGVGIYTAECRDRQSVILRRTGIA